MVPPLYEMDNFSNCMNENKSYCIVDFKLKANSEECSSWLDIMNKEHTGENIFSREYLHRGFCLDAKSTNDKYEDIKTSLENIVNSNISRYNLTADVFFHGCLQTSKEETTQDFFTTSLLTILLTAVVCGTILDKRKNQPQSSLEEILQEFSLPKNWAKVCKVTGTADFNRLKSIQGMRVLVMTSIILTHTIFKMIMIFYENVEDLEQLLRIPTLEFVLPISVLQVNVFFLISAFLLSNQICDIASQHGNLSMRNALVLVLNRYFRFLVPSLFIVVLSQMESLETFVTPESIKYWAFTKEACQSWWSTIFMYNNLVLPKNICYGPIWYLSGDFQAYVIITFLFYITYKFNFNLWKILSLSLLATCVLHATIVIFYNLDIMCKPDIRKFEMFNLLSSSEFVLLYTGLNSTLSVSILGAIFGVVYYNFKNEKSDKLHMVYKISWIIIFGGIPLFSLILIHMEYSRFMKGVMASVIKVIFVFGSGVGILGMSHSFGGYVKKVFESRAVLMISNISFCTYLFNYFTLMFGGSTEMVKFNISVLLQRFFCQLTVSLLGGLIITLIVEMPFLSLQKMLLPQVKRIREGEGKKND